MFLLLPPFLIHTVWNVRLPIILNLHCELGSPIFWSNIGPHLQPAEDVLKTPDADTHLANAGSQNIGTAFRIFLLRNFYFIIGLSTRNLIHRLST